MSTLASAPLSRRERLALTALVVAPALVFFVARVFGYVRFLKLAGLGVAGLACVLTLLVRPRWGVWALVFIIYAGIAFYSSRPGGVITAVVLAAVVLDLLLGAPNRLSDPLFWYANAFFLLIATASMMWAVDPKLSLEQLSTYFKVIAMTYFIVHLVRTPGHLRTLMNLIFVGAVATVVLGVMNLALGIQSVGDNYIHGSEYAMRFMGTQGNPNRAAAFMCTAIPMGLFGIKQARRAMKPLWIAGVIIVIAGVFATFSRSVVFPLTAIFGAVLIREARSRRTYLVLVATLALAAILAPDVWWERIFGLKDVLTNNAQDWSVYNRLLALQTAWELFLKHPFTGVGLGNFVVAGAYKMFMRIVVHNSYLEILVDIGIFGLTTLFFILASGFRHTVAGARQTWKNAPSWMGSACFYCALSAVSIWMSAFFGEMPFRPPFWIPVATGLIIGNLRSDDDAARATTVR